MANELDDGTVGAMFRNFQPRVPEQPIYSMAAYVNKHVVVQSAANLTKDQALQYAQSMVNFFKTAEGAGPGHGAAVKVADGSNVLLLPGMHVSVIAMGQSPSTGKLNINWEKIFAWEDVLWSSTTKSSGGQMAPMLHGAEIGAALKAAGPKTDLVVYLNTTPSKKTHYRVVINRRFSVWEGDVQAGQNIAVLADPLPPSGYQSNAATGEGVWGQPKQKLQHPKWLRVVIDSVDQKLDNSVKLLPGMEVQVFAEALENQHQPMSPYAKGGQITPRLPPQLHGVDWSRAKGIIAGVDELEVHVEQEDGTLGAVKMGYRAQQPRVPAAVRTNAANRTYAWWAARGRAHVPNPNLRAQQVQFALRR